MLFWFGRRLGGSWGAWGSPRGSPGSPLGSLGSLLGFSWVAFASPGGSLGASRGLQDVSWAVLGAVWSVRAAKRYQHDAKMDIQSSTALKKARFPFYVCTGLAQGQFLLLFALLSQGRPK